MHKLACGGKLITGLIIFLFLSNVSLTAGATNGKECLTISREKIASTLKKMNVPVGESVFHLK